MKRVTSGGSSIKTPDFSQPSSFVQEVSAVGPAPIGHNLFVQQSTPQLQQQLISMNDIRSLLPPSGHTRVPSGVSYVFDPDQPVPILQTSAATVTKQMPSLPVQPIPNQHPSYPAVRVIQSEFPPSLQVPPHQPHQQSPVVPMPPQRPQLQPN